MGIGIISVIGSLLLCIIGLWKYFARKAVYRRKLADEAEANIKKAQTPSDFLDSFNDVGKL